MPVTKAQIDKMKAAMATTRARASGGGANIFKPSPYGGEATKFKVRLLPGANGAPPIYTDVQHYTDVEGGNGVCPKSVPEGGKPQMCALCHVYWDTMNAHKWTDDEKQVRRRLGPTTRFYANVVDRGKDNAIKVWSISKTLGNEILNFVDQYLDESIDVFDPKEGRDFNFIAEPMGGSFHKYVSPSFAPRKSAVGVQDWEQETQDLVKFARKNELTSDDTIESLTEILTDERMTDRLAAAIQDSLQGLA